MAQGNFGDWKSEVVKLMLALYGLVENDYGDDQRLRNSYVANETPQEFVDWFAEKYDLQRIDVMPAV